jgi:hypothetical protein
LADVLFNNPGEQVRNLTLGATKIVRNGGVGEVLRMAQSNVHNIRRPATALTRPELAVFEYRE